MESGAGGAGPMVLPSGAARAMASVPTLPPEPLRFSTTNCWPVISAILAHQSRDRQPGPPPRGAAAVAQRGLPPVVRGRRGAAAAGPALAAGARREDADESHGARGPGGGAAL